jgi:hypothetical protein
LAATQLDGNLLNMRTSTPPLSLPYLPRRLAPCTNSRQHRFLLLAHSYTLHRFVTKLAIHPIKVSDSDQVAVTVIILVDVCFYWLIHELPPGVTRLTFDVFISLTRLKPSQAYLSESMTWLFLSSIIGNTVPVSGSTLYL